MKKSIFALLFLLLALIITCVYQKTYTLYALNTSEGNTTLLIEQKVKKTSPKKEKAVVRKQTSSDTHKVLISTIEKRVESISPKKEEPVAKTQTKTDAQKVKIPTSEEEPSKAPTILEKIKQTVISVVSSNEKKPEVKAVSQEATSEIITLKQKSIPVEKEVVDFLLTILKERDAALANRDKAETKLLALIKQALKNRRIAIENMEHASTEIEVSHQKRLKERDSKPQNNIEEKGK